MPSRLELVLRAGQAAETGSPVTDAWGRKCSQYKQPQAHLECLERAMAQEAEWRREQEQRARERAARAAAQEAGARERRLAPATREELRRNEESLRAARAREQQVVDAYDAGQSNMRAIIRENQESTITQMYDGLDGVGKSTEDALHFLLEQEANEAVGSNPRRHLRIVALQNSLDHIQKLTQELTMLKSALDVPGEGYYARLERMFA